MINLHLEASHIQPTDTVPTVKLFTGYAATNSAFLHLLAGAANPHKAAQMNIITFSDHRCSRQIVEQAVIEQLACQGELI